MRLLPPLVLATPLVLSAQLSDASSFAASTEQNLLATLVSNDTMGPKLLHHANTQLQTQVQQSVSSSHPLALHSEYLSDTTRTKLKEGQPLNSKESKEVAQAEWRRYKQLRMEGHDEISNTATAIELRNYQLRKKKTSGFFHQRQVSLASVVFPGVSPKSYAPGEPVSVDVNVVKSKQTQFWYNYYSLPGCPSSNEGHSHISHIQPHRSNLGSRLQGYDPKPSPFQFNIEQDVPCTALCTVQLAGRRLKFLRNLIERQYRVELTLDNLPVLMRSKELNYAVRGYPVGFMVPAQDGLARKAYLYNHLKFAVTYNDVGEDGGGIHITAFDVHPVSIKHDVSQGNDGASAITSCHGMSLENEPSQYLSLEDDGSGVQVVYSYDVRWIRNDDLQWADRWDVYLIGSPDDDIQYFAILNSSIMIIIMVAGIIAMKIRTMRRNIAGYDQLQSMDKIPAEIKWKLLHEDVFRPPGTAPMILSIVIGTGTQLGTSFLLTMLCFTFNIGNCVESGRLFTIFIFVCPLGGCVGGYVSGRMHDIIETKNRKCNDCPTKVSETVRIVPKAPWHKSAFFTMLVGGFVSFGSIIPQFFFVMSALWLDQIYYNMGFILATTVLLTMTCALVSILLTHCQLCAEDHRWWWRSFWNCASAGACMYLYSIWFLLNRLDLIGMWSVVIYLSYMGMISVCFGLYCGSVGFLSSLWFTRKLYSVVP